MKKYRVGIVGLGFGQQVTLPVFQAHPQCEVVALSGLRPGKAQEVAAKFNVPRAYSSWKEMVASANLDILAIATPADVQYEILLEVAAQPQLAIFAEKPLTVTLPQALELKDKFSHTRAPFVIDFEFPEIASWVEFKERSPHYFTPDSKVDVKWCMQNFANRNHLVNWKIKLESGGGVLHSFGSHVLYNMEWFFAPIVQIRGSLGKNPEDQRDTVSLCEFDVMFANGAKGSCVLNSNDPSQKLHEFRVSSKGRELVLRNNSEDYVRGFTLTADNTIVNVDDSKGLAEWQKPFVSHPDGRLLPAAQLIRKLVYALDSVPNHSAPDFQAGFRVQQLIEAIVESHQKNREWMNV